MVPHAGLITTRQCLPRKICVMQVELKRGSQRGFFQNQEAHGEVEIIAPPPQKKTTISYENPDITMLKYEACETPCENKRAPCKKLYVF